MREPASPVRRGASRTRSSTTPRFSHPVTPPPGHFAVRGGVPWSTARRRRPRPRRGRAGRRHARPRAAREPRLPWRHALRSLRLFRRRLPWAVRATLSRSALLPPGRRVLLFAVAVFPVAACDGQGCYQRKLCWSAARRTRSGLCHVSAPRGMSFHSLLDCHALTLAMLQRGSPYERQPSRLPRALA